jgi:hypothetical protein
LSRIDPHQLRRETGFTGSRVRWRVRIPHRADLDEVRDASLYRRIRREPVVTVQLSDAEAWEFAQFLKRVGLSDYRSLAEGMGEAAAMLRAGEKIKSALAAVGYAPR